MRFIGNKEKLLDNLAEIINKTNISEGVFCDFFSGTANVGRYFKEKGFKIISSDILFFSYVLQKAYIENNKEPTFYNLLKNIKAESDDLFATPLDRVLHYLDSVKDKKSFIYKNYTAEGTKNSQFIRKFFTSKNGKRIDAIRNAIEEWRNKRFINNNEYYVLLACLIETVPFYANISGTYAAFLKNYDPRSLKLLKLRRIKTFNGKNKNFVNNKDSMDLLSDLKTDILYLDPPYNGRQYGPNYHLLETIAKYDNPIIKGVAGLRDSSNVKSDFCNKDKAVIALDKIASKAKYKYLLLSYNSEGIMPKQKILETLQKYGKVKLIQINYRRFKSNSNGESKHKKFIQEQVYLLKSM